jgi:hypothetical protein
MAFGCSVLGLLVRKSLLAPPTGRKPFLQEGRKNGFSLMGHNPNKGEVFHVSVDDQGARSIGRWTFEEGEAILGLLFITGTGDEGALKIRLRFEDDDTMIVIVDLPKPIVTKMIRVKRVEKDEK